MIRVTRVKRVMRVKQVNKVNKVKRVKRVHMVTRVKRVKRVKRVNIYKPTHLLSCASVSHVTSLSRLLVIWESTSLAPALKPVIVCLNRHRHAITASASMHLHQVTLGSMRSHWDGAHRNDQEAGWPHKSITSGMPM